MSRKIKIISSIVLLVIICIVSFFSYSVFRERYFIFDEQGEENDRIKLPLDNFEANDYLGNVDNLSINKEAKDSLLDNVGADKDMLIKVTEDDCDKRCMTLNKQEDIDYCKQVCGITPIVEQENDSDCDNLENLKRDYCFRDLAVTKKDFKICDKIDDRNIWEMCKNRITEELVGAGGISETITE